MARVFAILIATLFLGLAAPARMQGEDPAAGARNVIERQLDAFAHDDAVEAYAYAAPRIKAIFPNPNLFLAMVATTYPAVYRHRSVEFGRNEQNGDSLVQEVTFIDDEGQVWTAVYSLEKQDDGAWRISGCVIAKAAQKAL